MMEDENENGNEEKWKIRKMSEVKISPSLCLSLPYGLEVEGRKSAVDISFTVAIVVVFLVK